MVKRCSSCCYTCCSEITLSGFDLPVFPQLYAFTEGLTNTSDGNPPQRLSRFTLRTERHVREDGRMFFVRLDLFKSESRSVAQLQVTVFTPITMTSVSDRGTYTQEDFYFRYWHEPGRFVINNACARNAISFTPDLLIASGKTTSTVTNPQIGITTSPHNDNLMLANTNQSVPAVPAGAVGTAIGSVSVQLGVHSVWDTRTSHSVPVYVDGDQWMHNSNEVILQVAGEIVGEQNTLRYWVPAINDFVQVAVTPLSYTIACTALDGYSSTSQTRQYRFQGSLQALDEQISSEITVRLNRQPSCRYGGELQAQIINAGGGGVPGLPVVAKPPVEFIAGSPVGKSVVTTAGNTVFAQNDNFAGNVVVAHEYRTSVPGLFSSDTLQYVRWWYTPKVAYYNDRLRRCENPPCQPIDDQSPNQTFGPIGVPEGGLSLQADTEFPDFFLYRMYAYGFPEGQSIFPAVDTSSFVRFRWRCRLVGLQ